MKDAHKVGVAFWDNYGTLTAYNAKKITCPVPEDVRMREGMLSVTNDYDPTYYQMLRNFGAGNADDELFYRILD